MIKRGERKALYQVGSVSLLFYTIAHMTLGYPVSDGVLFSALDAREYRDVGDWLLGGADTQGTLVRPFLYPLLVATFHWSAGAVGVWAMQVLAWMATVLAIHLSVLRAGAGRALAWVASSLVLIDLSLFALTYHALTEVVATMLVSLITLHVVSGRASWRSSGYFIILVGLLGLLGLIKPLFFPLLLFHLFIIGPVFYRRTFIGSTRPTLLLLMALAPVLLQMALMFSRHAHVGISTIGETTFRNYLFARSFGKVHGMELKVAMDSVASMGPSQVKDAALQMPGMLVRQYLTHLEDNIYYAGGYTLEMAPGAERPIGTFIMDRINKMYCILHVLALIPCLYVFVLAYRRRAFGELATILIPMAVTYLVLLTSGISFWQGDRLILPAIGAWTFLYPVVIRDVWAQKTSTKNRIVSE